MGDDNEWCVFSVQVRQAPPLEVTKIGKILVVKIQYERPLMLSYQLKMSMFLLGVKHTEAVEIPPPSHPKRSRFGRRNPGA